MHDRGSEEVSEVTLLAVQLAMTTCKACKQSFVGADGQHLPIDDTTAELLSLRRLEPVLAMLDRCTQLRELTFGHVQRVGTLLEILSAHPLVGRLETLELAHVEIDDAGELIDFMRQVPTLKKLVLDGATAVESTRNSLERRRARTAHEEWIVAMPVVAPPSAIPDAESTNPPATSDGGIDADVAPDTNNAPDGSQP